MWYSMCAVRKHGAPRPSPRVRPPLPLSRRPLRRHRAGAPRRPARRARAGAGCRSAPLVAPAFPFAHPTLPAPHPSASHHDVVTLLGAAMQYARRHPPNGLSASVHAAHENMGPAHGSCPWAARERVFPKSGHGSSLDVRATPQSAGEGGRGPSACVNSDGHPPDQCKGARGIFRRCPKLCAGHNEQPKKGSACSARIWLLSPCGCFREGEGETAADADRTRAARQFKETYADRTREWPFLPSEQDSAGGGEYCLAGIANNMAHREAPAQADSEPNCIILAALGR
eukprot:gene22567-biopygen19260